MAGYTSLGVAAMGLWLAIYFLCVQQTVSQEPPYEEVFKYDYRQLSITEQFECLDGWESRGTSCYLLNNATAVTWDDAAGICRSQGAHLARLKDVLEVIDVAGWFAAGTEAFWIDLKVNDIATYSGVWSDGTPVDLAVGHWAANQPDVGDGSVVCTKVMIDPAQYHPYSLDICGRMLPFVCQTKACITGQFRCADGGCINADYICDTINDCDDASDESGSATEPTCGQSQYLTGATGELSSSNHPATYNPKEDAQWVIEAPFGTKIQLEITAFDTEKDYDILSVFEGGRSVATSKAVGSISGAIAAGDLPTFSSSNNYMILRFISDDTVEKTGFKARWTTEFTCNIQSLAGFGYEDDDALSETSGGAEAACSDSCFNNAACGAVTYNTVTMACVLHKQIMVPTENADTNYWSKSCPEETGAVSVPEIPGSGGDLEASSTVSYLHSPLYPQPYYGNSVSFRITAPQDLNIITFSRMDISLGPGDTLAIYDGLSASDAKLVEYPKDDLLYVTTTQNQAYVYFDTKSAERGRGFFLSYQIGCTYIYEGENAVSGLIQTPAYSIKNYPHQQTCTWTINTGPGVPFAVDFGREDQVVHASDTIGIFETDGGTSITWTGFTSYNANGTLFVKFISNAADNEKGFRAYFSTDCPQLTFNSNTKIDGMPAGPHKTGLGQSFSVSCAEGYYFAQEEFFCGNSSAGFNPAFNMTCEIGGVWNVQTQPECAPVYCGEVPAIPNSYISNITSFYLGGEVHYTCFDGFAPSVDKPVVCQANATWGTEGGVDFTCGDEKCPALSAPANGAMNFTYGDSSTLTFGTLVTFKCDEGYELTAGSPAIFCQKWGNWSDPTPPVCSIRDCCVPVVEKATTTPASGYVDFGATVTVTCDTGYEINGTATITCLANGTFQEVPKCLDIDECLAGAHDCADLCNNTDGSFTCSCSPGYRLNADQKNCDDIDECSEYIDDCSDTCTNVPVGSYTCSCPAGYSLFAFDGYNDYSVATGETGNDPGDVYRFNHTCVRNNCTALPAEMENGTFFVFDPTAVFHYEDTVSIFCNLGYVINDQLDQLEANITCQADGSWSPALPQCNVARCPVDALNLTGLLKAPVLTPGAGQFVDYGSVLTMNCTVPGEPSSFIRTRTCLYDFENNEYALIGDTLECGVIDCGDPRTVGNSTASIPGLDEAQITALDSDYTLGQKFTYTCTDGFVQEGVSEAGTDTVECVRDDTSTPDELRGYWDFGNLTCAGATCTDPGRPPDGKQVVGETAYEEGAVITFICDRLGFTPVPEVINCYKPGGANLTWNGTTETGPECVDTEVPVFGEGECGQVKYIKKYDSPGNDPPIVTDNSGGLQNLTTNVDINGPVVNDTEVVWTATDHAGNEATCNISIKVIDEAGADFLVDCSVQAYDYSVRLNGSSDVVTQTIDEYLAKRAGILYKTSGNITSIEPSAPYTVGEADLYKALTFTATLQVDFTDGSSSSKTCSFQLTVLPEVCQSWALPTPKNGQKVCTSDTGPCTLTCDSGYRFHGTEQSLVYLCDPDTDKVYKNTIFNETVPNCVEEKPANYTIEYYLEYEGTLVTGNQANYTNVLQAHANLAAATLMTDCEGVMSEGVTVPAITFTAQPYDPPVDAGDLKVLYRVEMYADDGTDDIAACANFLDYAIKNMGPTSATDDIETIRPNTHPTDPDINVKPETVKQQFANYSCPDDQVQIDDFSATYCIPCPSGYYMNTINTTTPECELCPLGEYQPAEGTEQCIECPSGKYTRTKGSSADSDCLEKCSAGFWSETRLPPCVACPNGTYWVDAGNCSACPAGSKTAGVQGGLSIDDCKPACGLGNFSDTGFEPCRPCPRGYYQDATGATDCLQCTGGQTTDGEGSTDAGNCTASAANACKNGTSVGNVCVCTPGFTGKECETDIDDCASQPCYYTDATPAAECVDGVNTFICICPTDSIAYFNVTPGKLPSGASDEIKSSFTAEKCQDACKNTGACLSASFDSATADCFIFYSKGAVLDRPTFTWYEKNFLPDPILDGTRCEIDKDDCDSNPCKNSGMCQDLLFGFKCHCKKGFTGDTCADTDDICDAEGPCQNGGTCRKLADFRLRCVCAAGFTGTNCEINIDECDPNPCLYGGDCIDGDNAFTCVCPTGFTGDKCETRPASLCQADSCGANVNIGKCFDLATTSAKACACKPGYTSEGYWTEWQNSDTGSPDDIELTGDNALCTSGGEITDVNCRVVDTKMDYITGGNDNITCTLEGLVCYGSDCKDYEVQYFCSLGLEECIDANECTEDAPCENDATCTNQDLTYECKCDDGYTGFNCQVDINECASDPCQHGGTCNDLVNSYNCTCPDEYDGVSCENYIPGCQCDSTGSVNPVDCVNGMQPDFSCECLPGYTGKNCSEEINECSCATCFNHGGCIDLVNGFECNCTEGWTGEFCEEMILQCQADTCQNGGTCYDVFNGFLCICAPGFYGELCADEINVCDSADPCQNGGTCSQENGTVTCQCTEHYTGPGCECARDYCSAENNVCQNDGVCSVLDVGGYNCDCPDGFSGLNCEDNIDDCAGVSCSAGSCVDGLETYICQCPVGMAGPDCSKAINRELDLVFEGSGGANSLYPFNVNKDFTFGMWVVYLPGSTGTFFQLINAKSQFDSSYDDDDIFLEIGAEGLTFTDASGAEQNASVPLGLKLADQEWHYVGFSWDKTNNKIEFYVDNVKSADTLTNLPEHSENLIVHLGSQFSDPEKFAGRLSWVQAWNRVLKFEDEYALLKDDTKKGADSSTWPPWLEDDLQVDWDWGGYGAGTGVLKVLESLRGLPVCPTGQTYDTTTEECIGPDKFGPEVKDCPGDMPVLVDEQYTSLEWDSPTFTDTDGTVVEGFSNFNMGGNLFQLGHYPVVYVSKDVDNNWATCSFSVYGRLKECPDPLQPPATTVTCSSVVNGFMKRCELTCDNPGEKPLTPTPIFYSCGFSGVYNVLNPYVPIRLPACGVEGAATQDVEFGWTYPVTDGYDPLQDESIRLGLLEKLKQWYTDAGETCPPDPDCGFEVLVAADLDPPGAAVTVTKEGMPVQINGTRLEDAIRAAAVQLGLFDLPLVAGAENIPPETFYFDGKVICDSGFQAQGDSCVQCTEGTYFDAATEMCETCPKGQYQSARAQTSCEECDAGKTTPTYGAVDVSECIAICGPGNFYNMSGGQCELCPRGFYQLYSNETFCLPCPIGRTTDGLNPALTVDDCSEECPDGHQMRPDGTCELCPVGKYRRRGFQVMCEDCRQETVDGVLRHMTTLYNGSVGQENCTRVLCPAGWYRLGDDPGSCLPCQESYYRTAEMDNCTWCGEGTGHDNWNTDMLGASSRDQCKFYCPAGMHVEVDAANNTSCVNCSLDTYKVEADYYATNCTQCVDRRTLAEGSKMEEDCVFAACDAGYILDPVDMTMCKACDHATYQDDPRPMNGTECILCGDGKTTASMNSTSVDQCLDICPSGEEMISGTCQVCDRGYFKDNTKGPAASLGMCEMCSVELITPGTGSISETNCTQGNCTAGYYIKGDKCNKCPKGRYQPEKWKESCTECPPESTTKEEGAVAEAECNIYPNRTKVVFKLTLKLDFVEWSVKLDTLLNWIRYILEIWFSQIPEYRGPMNRLGVMPHGSLQFSGVGLFEKSSTDLAALVEQKINEALATGLNSELTRPDGGTDFEPLPVTDDFVAQAVTLPAETTGDVTDPDIEGMCDAGRLLNLVTAKCEVCPVNTYQLPDMGNNLCDDCPAGYVTDPAITSPTPENRIGTQEQICFITCGPGEQRNSANQCELCPLNKYKDTGPDVKQCIQCSPPNLVTAEKGSNSSADCFLKCLPGKYANAGKTECLDCPKDQYQDEADQTECKACPEGTQTSGVGKASETDCLDACALAEQNGDSFCENGGTCYVVGGTTSCICTKNYEGTKCQKRKGSGGDGNIPMIAGIIGGVLFLLLLIALLACLFQRRRRRPYYRKEPQPEMNSQIGFLPPVWAHPPIAPGPVGPAPVNYSGRTNSRPGYMFYEEKDDFGSASQINNNIYGTSFFQPNRR